MKTNVAQLIELPKFLDKRGNLSFIEEFKHLPFKIERAYWVYDVPGGEVRGGHAYKDNQEFIVALSGSFDVLLDDGIEKKSFFVEPFILWALYSQGNMARNKQFFNKFFSSYISFNIL